MTTWLIVLGVILIIFLVLEIFAYYDIDPTIDISWVNVRKKKLRRIKDQKGFYHIQKKYFPGFWKDISGKRIEVPSENKELGILFRNVNVIWERHRDCEIVFVQFFITTDGATALEFQEALLKAYKGIKGKGRKRINPITKFKPFIPGGKEKSSVEEKNNPKTREPRDQKLD